MTRGGRKVKRSDRSSTEEEPRAPKRKNMAPNSPEEATGELAAGEPSLSEIRNMLVGIESKMSTILAKNNDLSSELAELKNAFEAQKRKLNDTKELLEKTMNLNSQLKEELSQARDKIKEQAEEIAELYDLQDELEQYTRKNSVDICGIPENACESTEEAVLKISKALNVTISSEDIEITHHLNRKGVEKGTRPIIVKFISHKVKSKLYKSRAKLKNVRVHQLFPNHSAVISSKQGGRIFINENLTSSRIKVVMKANQMRKDGLLVSCWTFDGKIYIKTSPDGKPVRIHAEDDLTNI